MAYGRRHIILVTVYIQLARDSSSTMVRLVLDVVKIVRDYVFFNVVGQLVQIGVSAVVVSVINRLAFTTDHR